MALETFIDRYLKGEVKLEEIDDAIDLWHTGISSLELHQYLGLTWEEYSYWVQQPSSLAGLLSQRTRRYHGVACAFLDRVIEGVDYRVLSPFDLYGKLAQLILDGLRNETLTDEQHDELVAAMEPLWWAMTQQERDKINDEWDAEDRREEVELQSTK